MIVKLIGFGIRDYFFDPYNCFDCFLVIAFTVDIGEKLFFPKVKDEGKVTQRNFIDFLQHWIK